MLKNYVNEEPTLSQHEIILVALSHRGRFANSRILVTECIFLGRTHILGDQGLEAF